MATRGKKAKPATASGEAAAVEQSDDAMRRLAASLAQGLDLALRAQALTGMPAPPSAKVTKKKAKESLALARKLASAEPPPLESDQEI